MSKGAWSTRRHLPRRSALAQHGSRQERLPILQGSERTTTRGTGRMELKPSQARTNLHTRPDGHAVRRSTRGAALGPTRGCGRDEGARRACSYDTISLTFGPKLGPIKTRREWCRWSWACWCTMSGSLSLWRRKLSGKGKVEHPRKTHRITTMVATLLYRSSRSYVCSPMSIYLLVPARPLEYSVVASQYAPAYGTNLNGDTLHFR